MMMLILSVLQWLLSNKSVLGDDTILDTLFNRDS